MARVPSGERWAMTNEPAAMQVLLGRLRVLDPTPTLVVLEATGGLEAVLAAMLAEAGPPVVMVNPRQVCDFARATGRLAKTDAIVAAVFARFPKRVRSAPRPLPDADAPRLGLLARLRQLLEILVAKQDQLARAEAGFARDVRTRVAWLRNRVTGLDDELQCARTVSPDSRAKNDRLQSVPAVARVLALTLIAELAELGTLNRKEVAVLVGVAPLNRDTGMGRGRCQVWGGRASVRATLSQAAM